MPLDELVQRLVNVTPGYKLFLSVYLDLRPDRSGKKRYLTFLKNHLPELSNLVSPHSPAKPLLAKDIKRLENFLEEKLDPAWKGIALYACAAEDLFIPIPMPVPPENAVSLAPFPYLFSLVRHADLYQTHAIIVTHSRQARLFIVRLGHLEKQLNLSWEDKHNTRFGRMGLSLPRFQRHIKEHIKQQAKEIVGHLEKLIPLGKMDSLLVAAEEGIEAELKKQFPTSAQKKLILFSCDFHDPDHKVLAAASEALQAISRGKTEALTRQILEEAEPLNQAITGPEPTLTALQNHQIERIVFDTQFKATGWKCSECNSLGSGGLPSACPLCEGGILSTDLREEMIVKAKSQGVELFFMESFPPLRKAEGIAALLKYKIPRRSPK